MCYGCPSARVRPLYVEKISEGKVEATKKDRPSKVKDRVGVGEERDIIRLPYTRSSKDSPLKDTTFQPSGIAIIIHIPYPQDANSQRRSNPCIP